MYVNETKHSIHNSFNNNNFRGVNMIITTNNITYPDYSFEIIETNRDSVAISVDPENDYEIPIDIDYEDIPIEIGDRVTGWHRHEWNAETMTETDLRKEILKNFNYRKII